MSLSRKAIGSALVQRTLESADCITVHALAQRCGGLTVHTPYAYWALLEIYQGYSVGVETCDGLHGFVLVTRAGRETAFVWQLGVVPTFRGRGVGAALLRSAVLTAGRAGVTRILATVAPSNAASVATFESVARSVSGHLEQSVVENVPDTGPRGDRERLLTLTKSGQ